MPALLAAVEQAIAGILEVLGVSQLIYGLLQNLGIVVSQAAKEHTPYQIERVVFSTNLETIDPDHGLAAIKRVVDAISAGQIALGNPQQASQPVTLPTVPPAGYGGSSSGDVAAAVWNYSQGGGSQTAQNLLIGANNIYGYLGETFALQLSCDSHFYLRAAWAVNLDIGGTDVQSFTTGGILLTDASILEWLNRAFPAFAWFLDTDSAHGARANLTGENDTWVYCLMSPAEFYWLRANMAALAVPTLAPVWPGLADVTFDVPTAFADVAFTVVGPMDGITIDLTTIPQPMPQYNFNGAISYRYLGSLTFEDDNGNCEAVQGLGFASAIYVPKTMNHASFCRIRPNRSGIVGTVTPWTKT